MEFLGFDLTFSSVIGVLKLLLSIVVFVGVNQYMGERPRGVQGTPKGFLNKEKYLYSQTSKTTQAFLKMAAASTVLIITLEIVF